GLDSIRIGLNGVYNLTESRSYWKTKLLSLTLTLGLAILVTIALGVVFFGGKFVSLILNSINLSISSPFFLGVLQTVTVLVVLISIFALLYNFLPKHKKSSWVWITPGAIISIILWLLLSYAFRLYLGYFDSYSKTYGSLGAVIILMLWLYLTALVILIGGSINAVLQEYSDPETAKAGANKAAAKAIIENPDGAMALDKKAETLAILNQDSAGKEVSTKNKSSQTTRTDLTADNKPVDKKSAFKLIAGVLIGFISNIRKR
ncbi:MAG: YihY/virulence factor BrkB family protein, partial [Acidobacteria bacterium]|nr:YihY/virulence factor BrkB family protein [Acidobacteriota bacterium]